MTTVQDIRDRTGDDPITMLTAYDTPTARIADEAGIDILLVGDSMGNAVMGYDSTLPVTVDDVASRTGAVARGTADALVVADMPFLSYGADEADAVENAGRLIREAGADAVKLECGPHTVGLTERLVNLGIPVMAHVGLTPQRINQLGLEQQGATAEAAAEIESLAETHQTAGAFSVVLEHVPDEVAADITAALSMPTIGIGAGDATDGQVLVVTDVLGLSENVPPFAEQFGDVAAEMRSAIEGYRDAVVDGSFPGDD
ncbi:3-methyl-2-oxobutanoate hydroxymethyltransferase [Halarchaeum salinum]|uniref:3-methyl-2-oxobutanoate hydroxymethyltransferase n=1 Tax=Halarchaeum salinum TaxID=489912 RepID=A0AAV3S8E8_9EURY